MSEGERKMREKERDRKMKEKIESALLKSLESFEEDFERYTQRNVFEILLNQTEINRKGANTI